MLVKFKAILRRNGISGKSFCGLLGGGLSYSSYRVLTRRGVGLVPRWVRSFVMGYELGRLDCDCKKNGDDSQAS